jgi:hypothetical protein
MKLPMKVLCLLLLVCSWFDLLAAADNSFPQDPHEYNYDAAAIHEQWQRDLAVWNSSLDDLIRQRHADFASSKAPRRQLQAAVDVKNYNQAAFIDSLSVGDPNEEVGCFIGYKSLHGRREVIRAALQSPHTKHDFGEVNSIAVVLPKWKLLELYQLKAADHIEFMERDEIIYPDQVVSSSSYLINHEVVPYGIDLVQAHNLSEYTGFAQNNSLPNSCSNSSSFKIAIVDAGYAVGHQDLPCRSASGANCIGSSFGLAASELWYNPVRDHGTHVSGTHALCGCVSIWSALSLPHFAKQQGRWHHRSSGQQPSWSRWNGT